jgi:hypothetical protein
MTDQQRPGQGSKPAFETQTTAAGLGKPAQVPGEPGGEGPNADGFDLTEGTERLRPRDVEPTPTTLRDDPLDGRDEATE